MLKHCLILCIFSSFFSVQAQHAPDPEEVVIAFFNAFHQQDTLALRDLVHPRIKMQSVSASKNESVKLTTTNFDDFLKSIASIPKTTNFEERILGYKIQSDDLMANVWTPYEFYINGEMSHCGVNSFQLIWVDKQWKIVYIVDTRKSESCE